MVTADTLKPGTSGVAPSSDDRPVDDLYSSSSEADSDSLFPDSSDSELETATGFQQAASDGVTSGQKQVKPVRSGGGKTPIVVPPQVLQDKPEEEVTTSTVSTAKKPPENEDTTQGVTAEVPDGWTGAEVTYFRILHPVFGHNYCMMAGIIRTKTCQQLYEYGCAVSAELLQQHGESMERPQLVGKKKKRNMRWV